MNVENADIVKEFENTQKAAAAGDLEARFNLSVMYEEGLGVQQNHDTALTWLHMAAEAGYPEAQYTLGHMYVQGNGVPKNLITATKWFRKAAASGYPHAKYHLIFTLARRIRIILVGRTPEIDD